MRYALSENQVLCGFEEVELNRCAVDWKPHIRMIADFGSGSNGSLTIRCLSIGGIREKMEVHTVDNPVQSGVKWLS